ncbi:hypothetical protein KQI49_02040 [Virgibacillus sp. MSJ-26]|uniref:hypothetical protein n=1 Tax=Virgibacillus sp. MSJ-26 TaxID=2841522 RepID=UPI001C0F76B7|nr:hypothetical protein [Virgibacillus sp. MSJ-26]MBU5465608.1 hypothetical protein [Virgibacillus sp. MSJ-26]
MEKEKVMYRFIRYNGRAIDAKREVSFEIKLMSRMILDEICFNWNKEKLLEDLDYSFVHGNQKEFLRISEEYKQYVWE